MLTKDSIGWQFHTDLDPEGPDLTIHKTHGNAFQDTILKDELDSKDIGVLVITGLVTQGCVRATCIGGYELGYRIVLVEDGHSNYNRDAQKLIKEWNQNLNGKFVELFLTAEIEFMGI
jgi:nicotinamidase-related amidase